MRALKLLLLNRLKAPPVWHIAGHCRSGSGAHPLLTRRSVPAVWSGCLIIGCSMVREQVLVNFNGILDGDTRTVKPFVKWWRSERRYDRMKVQKGGRIRDWEPATSISSVPNLKPAGFLPSPSLSNSPFTLSLSLSHNTSAICCSLSCTVLCFYSFATLSSVRVWDAALSTGQQMCVITSVFVHSC